VSRAVAVVVVGSVNEDLVISVPRLPAPGETITGGTLHTARGGKGANQAVAAARLGARTWLVGLTGDDEYGRRARDDLREGGVDVSELGLGPSPTGVALIVVDEHGENLIAVASGANDEVTGEIVSRSLRRIDVHEAVVLANLEVRDEAVVTAAVEARTLGWRFVLNPAPARALPAALVHACDVITPNETEANMLGYPSPDALLAEGVGAVVVTRGPAGADLLRPDRPAHHQDAFPIRAIDTTGAGDAFSAALAWAVARGSDLEEGVRLAAGAGALAARAVGARTSLPDRAELERFVVGPAGVA
jgi:ribokinase